MASVLEHLADVYTRLLNRKYTHYSRRFGTNFAQSGTTSQVYLDPRRVFSGTKAVSETRPSVFRCGNSSKTALSHDDDQASASLVGLLQQLFSLRSTFNSGFVVNQNRKTAERFMVADSGLRPPVPGDSCPAATAIRYRLGCNPTVLLATWLGAVILIFRGCLPLTNPAMLTTCNRSRETSGEGERQIRKSVSTAVEGNKLVPESSPELERESRTASRGKVGKL